MERKSNALAAALYAEGKTILLSGFHLDMARQFAEKVFESNLAAGIRPIAREVRMYIDQTLRIDASASDHAQALTKFAALLSALDHKANRSTAH